MFKIVTSKRLRDLELSNVSIGQELASSRDYNVRLNESLGTASAEIKSLQYELNLYKEKVHKIESQRDLINQTTTSEILSICEVAPSPKRILHSKRTLKNDLDQALQIINQIKSYFQGQ